MNLDFTQPARRQTLAGGRVTVDTVVLGRVEALRVAHTPGWRWSVHSNADSDLAGCPKAHVGLMLSGVLGVRAADGTEYEARPGELLVIRPGHDAWTVGDEPAVLVQFGDGLDGLTLFGLDLSG